MDGAAVRRHAGALRNLYSLKATEFGGYMRRVGWMGTMRTVRLVLLTGLASSLLLLPAWAQSSDPNLKVTYGDNGVTVQGYGPDAPQSYSAPQPGYANQAP